MPDGETSMLPAPLPTSEARSCGTGLCRLRPRPRADGREDFVGAELIAWLERRSSEQPSFTRSSNAQLLYHAIRMLRWTRLASSGRVRTVNLPALTRISLSSSPRVPPVSPQTSGLRTGFHNEELDFTLIEMVRFDRSRPRRRRWSEEALDRYVESFPVRSIV
jgi:hypothetical protein